jgi:hypothetical protein
MSMWTYRAYQAAAVVQLLHSCMSMCNERPSLCVMFLQGCAVCLPLEVQLVPPAVQLGLSCLVVLQADAAWIGCTGGSMDVWVPICRVEKRSL